MQKQNLINEYKGHILEFLLGLELSTRTKKIKEFYQYIPKETINILTHYQNQLMILDFHLSKKMPNIAVNIANELEKYICLKDISYIEVIGKIKADISMHQFHEADLLIHLKDSQIIPIGLKFCRYNCYVNTKNAGLKSIISTYFPHKSAIEKQQALDLQVQSLFEELGSDLYATKGEHFLGEFDQRWTKDWGLSQLPGQLPKIMQKRVHQYYYQIITKIYNFFQEWEKNNPQCIEAFILPFLGLSIPNLVQICCFHDGVDEYNIKNITITRLDSYFNKNYTIKILQPKLDQSFFEIHLYNCILQIRVKPMNIFTTSNVKINCSVKYKTE